jgi:type I restriction enzyme S subunit
MTVLLTDNLPLLAGAPNGIKKLRELILELAVRGKLVPQDSSDEPASELFKRIVEEKARLVAQGNIKKPKSLPPITEVEKPFGIASSWGWKRLLDCSVLVTDGEHLTPQRTSDRTQIPLVTAKNVRDGFIDYQNTDFVDQSIAEKCWGRCKPDAGDIMMVSVGATLGRLAVLRNSVDMVIVRSVTLIRPLFVDPDYLAIALRSPKLQRAIWAGVKQSAQPGLYLAQSNLLLIPVPPMSEQHRIVAKVNELMALCERLEAQQADAESAHAQIVKVLLESLTQASDGADFDASWQRLAEHFHILFTTESSIDALKQALLQLAVMGKLVPQNPSDEPAGELIKRIWHKKQQLIAEKTIKTAPSLDPVTDSEKLFDIPWTWAWVRMGEICRPVSSGSTPSAELFQYDGGVPFLKVYNIRNQEIDFDYKKQFVPPKHHAEKMKRSILVPGDVVMNIVGPPLGKAAIIPNTFPEWNCNQAIVFFGLIPPIDPQYVLTFLKEGSFLKNIPLIGTAGQDNISVTKSKNIAIPIPPLAEQHRIVAKLEKLTALCNQLKNRITKARHFNEQLVSVLVERALTVDSDVAIVATNEEKARTLLAAEIVQQLHCEKRMGRVKLQKVISLAEHVACLKEIQSKEERYAAGPHDPALMSQAVQSLRENQWFEELALDDGKRYEYRPLDQSGAHRPAYEALWTVKQRQKINELIELMRPWDTARCERVATLYSAWNDLLIEGREASEAAILQEVLHGWNESKLKYSEAQWRAELAEMHQHSFLIPTGFGKRTSGGKLTLPGFEPSI